MHSRYHGLRKLEVNKRRFFSHNFVRRDNMGLRFGRENNT